MASKLPDTTERLALALAPDVLDTSTEADALRILSRFHRFLRSEMERRNSLGITAPPDITGTIIMPNITKLAEGDPDPGMIMVEAAAQMYTLAVNSLNFTAQVLMTRDPIKSQNVVQTIMQFTELADNNMRVFLSTLSPGGGEQKQSLLVGPDGNRLVQ